MSGSEIEFYMYSADGDLAAVFGRSGPQVFAYDGTQMIAAFDLNGDPQWEATERHIPRVARSFAGLRRPSLHRPPRRFEGIVCVGRLRPGRRILAETPVRPHGMYRLGDGIDQLIEYRDFAAAGPIVPLADHRNSPIATWNPTTEAIEQLARYDLHGRLTLLDANEMLLCAEQDNPGIVCDPPSGVPFAFNGRWRSPLTGLVNMRARWYSPRLGQFTAPDPLGYVDLYNLYGFAAFDPVNGWDPSGFVSRHFVTDAHPYTSVCPPGTSCLPPDDPPPPFPCAEPGMGKLCGDLAVGELADSPMQLDDLIEIISGVGAVAAVGWVVIKIGGKWVLKKLVKEGGEALTERFGKDAAHEFGKQLDEAQRLVREDPWCFDDKRCADLADKFIEVVGEGKRVNYDPVRTGAVDERLPVNPEYAPKWKWHSVVELDDDRIVDVLTRRIFPDREAYERSVFTGPVSPHVQPPFTGYDP